MSRLSKDLSKLEFNFRLLEDDHFAVRIQFPFHGLWIVTEYRAYDMIKHYDIFDQVFDYFNIKSNVDKYIAFRYVMYRFIQLDSRFAARFNESNKVKEYLCLVDNV